MIKTVQKNKINILMSLTFRYHYNMYLSYYSDELPGVLDEMLETQNRT